MQLLNRVQEFLLKRDVTSTIEGDDLFIQARCETLGFRIRVTATKSTFTACANIGLFIPVERRAAMYEGLSRANWNLKFARLEMDSDDGELRLRADMPLYDAELTDEQIKRVIFACWALTEQYAPALLQIMMSTDVEPAVAIARVENSGHQEVMQLHGAEAVN
jgi:hypothetical protein